MENTKKNQQDFMERICKDTWKDVYRFIYYKVQNREEAEDITQETYAKALSYLNRNENKVMDYGNYLKTISMNIIRDQWRSRKKKGYSVNIEDVNPEEMATEDFSDEVNNRTLMEKAMEHLTKEQQTVITLRIIKGFSVSETAKLMKKKEGTVRVIQYRAVKALADILQTTYKEEFI